MNRSMIEALARPEILALKAYVSARNSATDQGVLLNANELPWSSTGLDAGEVPELKLNRYPSPQPAELVEKLSRIYGVQQNQLLITRGSDEGIDLLTRVFCRAGQDAILQSSPCFGMYGIAANIQGAAIIDCPRSEDDDFQLPTHNLIESLRQESRIRLVFLTSPNNPTGDLIPKNTLTRILDSAANQAIVIVDEAYIEFSPEDSASSLLDQYPQLVVLRTLSKAWGAAGLRCGAVIADPCLIQLLARIIPPYPLPAPSIALALNAVQQASQLEAISKLKERLIEMLSARSWVEKLWPGAANFILVKVDHADNLTRCCAEQGVQIRNFSSQPGLDNCVRITVGSDEDLDRLEAAFGIYEQQGASTDAQ